MPKRRRGGSQEVRWCKACKWHWPRYSGTGRDRVICPVCEGDLSEPTIAFEELRPGVLSEWVDPREWQPKGGRRGNS